VKEKERKRKYEMECKKKSSSFREQRKRVIDRKKERSVKINKNPEIEKKK